MIGRDSVRLLLAIVTSIALTPALAADPIQPIPITAEEAFDATVTSTDPILGTRATVALVDVRSRAEYWWVGTAAAVTGIVLKGQEATPIRPDFYKVRVIDEGKFLEFTLRGRYRRVQVDKVAELQTTPIASSIPYKLWDETQAKLVGNPAFAGAISKLADDGVQVLIVFCRSGGRSSDCIVQIDPTIAARFSGVYEIDDPGGLVTGVGGFEGAGYAQVYNGHLGFPGRLTQGQTAPSVSWKDAGLPIRIGQNPLVPIPPLPQ
jgi:rhodanese-related sulfurtransferase